MSKIVCRTCLVDNNRMHDLKNTPLQEIFEKLTSTKLSSEDVWSRICYICYSQLQRCSRFLDMAQQADKMFKQVLTKGIVLIPESVTALRPTNNFIVTPVDCMSLPDHSLETIKVEPVDIKEEMEEPDHNGLCEAVKMEGSPSADEFMQSLCDQKAMPAELHNKTYHSQKSWKRHITEAHSKKLAYNGKKSNKKFDQLPAPTPHLQFHKEEKMYTCDICDKTFTIKSVFQSHLRKHTKPFTCQFCKKSFSELSSLRKHVTSHSTDKPYICDCCNKGFSHRSLLIVHLRTHSGDKPYACELCDRTFAQSGHKTSHMRGHQLFQCTICSMSFTKSDYLNHMTTHKTYPTRDPDMGTRIYEKPYACMFCDMTFAQSGHAASHMRSHTSARPFSCTQCDKSFAERNTLNKHMRTHTGLRPFACEVCNKTFAQRDTVKSHMRTHTGEKPYVCVGCGKAFSTSGNMRKHMKTHHTETQNAPLQI